MPIKIIRTHSKLSIGIIAPLNIYTGLCVVRARQTAPSSFLFKPCYVCVLLPVQGFFEPGKPIPLQKSNFINLQREHKRREVGTKGAHSNRMLVLLLGAVTKTAWESHSSVPSWLLTWAEKPVYSHMPVKASEFSQSQPLQCLCLLYRHSNSWKRLEAEVPPRKLHLVLLDYPARRKELGTLFSRFLDESNRDCESWDHRMCVRARRAYHGLNLFF